MPQNSCSIPQCKNSPYKAESQCILHCSKNSYEYDSTDYNHMISEFNRELANDISNQVSNYYNEGYLPNHITAQVVLECFTGRIPATDWPRDIRNYLEDVVFTFNQVDFPFTKGRDTFSYFPVIVNCKKIYFRQCTFNVNFPLKGNNYHLFYDECTFLKQWSIKNNSILENESEVLYQACKFTESVSIYTPDDLKPYTIEASLFNDCIFEKDLELDNTIFIKPIFNNASDHEAPINIKKLMINRCAFEQKFILNKLSSDALIIKNTEFKSKFELKNGVLEEAEISNTNFEKLVDSFGTKYMKFKCFKSIFSDFVGFENCVFSISKDDPLPTFQYSTFLNFTNFRKTQFHSGLCLEEANFKEPPNFLHAQLEQGAAKNIRTSRETLRIIKFSFDRLGNQIEANKYFVLEMKKHQQDLSKHKTKQNMWERWALFLNNKISDFGQSYIRPICIYIVLGLMYFLLTLGQEKNYLYKIYPPINNCISTISEYLNAFALNILPFKTFLRPGMEIISLFFYIIFAVLTWQIITSVKRITKR